MHGQQNINIIAAYEYGTTCIQQQNVVQCKYMYKCSNMCSRVV